MNRILELDSKSGEVTVEPGLNFGKLQQALHTHGRFLPPYPGSMNYSTIGGAVSNNSGGEKSVKYGNIGNFVKGLRVVLSNGEVIETKRLSKKELNKKMGLSNYEGEIYRAVDTLIEENHKLIEKLQSFATRTSAGYNLAEVKKKDKSFDLTPLFVGAQGTLGLISQITLETEAYTPRSTLVIGHCEQIAQAEAVIAKLRAMKNSPSAIELIDGGLLDFVDKTNPNLIKNLIKKPYPGLILIIEFNDQSDKVQVKLAKQAKKIFEGSGIEAKVETDDTLKNEAWKIRDLASSFLGFQNGSRYALPIIEDGIVPFDQFPVFMKGLYDIFSRNSLVPAIWGQAGEANLHVYPQIDLSQLGDRQKTFRVMDEFYNLVIALGGSTSAQNNDGRIRAPYLEKLYGPEAYVLFNQLKAVFDPYNILNPGVKLGVTIEDIKPLLRNSYSLNKVHDHLPRA